MTKNRFEHDTFVRRPMAGIRARLDHHSLAAEADVAGQEVFMEAAIAAAMIIAHADGGPDIAEHRRVIAHFRANHRLQGFSAEDISREIATHTEAFRLNPVSALKAAKAQIVMADLSHEQFRSILHICLSVIEADGVRHQAEEEAFAEISALRPLALRTEAP